MNFSKSKYCEFCQCPKMTWLRKNKPDVFVTDEDALGKFETGNQIGDLAMRYFGNFVEVTAYKNDKPDLIQMIKNTKSEIEKNTPVICEASFDFNGLYCAVDILCREKEGWSIYEVKSSVKADKDVYMLDVAYQKYVLEHCGIHVTGVYLMCIDNTYIFDGTLDLHKFFKITDVSDKVAEKMPDIEQNLKLAEKILADENEPDIDIGLQCSNPYQCGFWNYCTRNLPQPNVFHLYNMKKQKMFDFYHRGIVSYDALKKDNFVGSQVQELQIEYSLHEKELHVDRENLRGFLSSLSYPLYFLDFESVQPAVPKYAGTKPYAQIPFQYSLHYIETEGGELKHKEFLAEAGTDPRRDVAENLCRDIPENVTILAYNMTFECSRLKELAKFFPDLSAHLLNMAENIKDLVVPFRKGWYYNSRMGISNNKTSIFSIKNVLPAVFPDDPELDYHNLEGIQNGADAMTVFPAMEKMSPEEQAETRKNLLKYCGLDTLAMVRLWQALTKAAE